MKISPLDPHHRALSARMTEFGGWDMPLNYPAGTISEHLACRRTCVAFDVSHLGSVRTSGPGALDRLQKSFTNDLLKIGPGRAQYTHLLDETGSVVDDIIVWWVSEEDFLVMPNASNTDRVQAAVGGDDVTTERAVIAVQGPESRHRIEECWGADAWVPRFHVRSVDLGGTACIIAGTGYTGEQGVEIHVPAHGAAAVWKRLMDVGVIPAGLGARDTLRLEAGLPLYGHELGPGISPLQADLGWVVAWNKPEFIGRAALAAERASGPHRRLQGIVTQGRRPPRADAEVYVGDHRVGIVTSGNFSPVLECGIALALVEPECAVGQEVSVHVRDSHMDGTIARRPFVTPSSAQS